MRDGVRKRFRERKTKEEIEWVRDGEGAVRLKNLEGESESVRKREKER